MTRSRHQNTSLTAFFILILLCLPFTLNATSELNERDQYDFGGLGRSLCGTYNTDDGIIKHMRLSIANTMERVDGNANPTDKEIITFLNTHKNKLTCWGKHYLAKAFDEGVYMTVYKDLFKKDLYKKGEYQIGYNSITLIYNPVTGQEEPMTILDYIENVALKSRAIQSNSTSIRNVRYIQDMIMRRFGALNYVDLPEAEKKAFHSGYTTQKK